MNVRLRVLLGIAALLLVFRAAWTAGALLGSLYTGQDWLPWLTRTAEHVGVACIAFVAFNLSCREAAP